MLVEGESTLWGSYNKGVQGVIEAALTAFPSAMGMAPILFYPTHVASWTIQSGKNKITIYKDFLIRSHIL